MCVGGAYLKFWVRGEEHIREGGLIELLRYTCHKQTLFCSEYCDPPIVNHKGKDLNSDWPADQWDERSI